jgi:ketosteroid isomerase-like protein
MSQQNVEIVRSWLDEWTGWFNSERDPDRLSRIMSQYLALDFTYEEDPRWPDAGTFRGQDAIHRRVREYADLLHLERVSPGEVIDAGELVLAELRIWMLGTDAGEPVEFLWTFTVRVEDERVAHVRAWYNRADALEAAGLSE